MVSQGATRTWLRMLGGAVQEKSRAFFPVFAGRDGFKTTGPEDKGLGELRIRSGGLRNWRTFCPEEVVMNPSEKITPIRQEETEPFFQIPQSVLLHPDLSSTTKLVYALLMGFPSFRENGVCWASNGYFAQALGVTDRTIQSSLRQLRENGFLKDHGTKGKGIGRIKSMLVRDTKAKKTSFPKRKKLRFLLSRGIEIDKEGSILTDREETTAHAVVSSGDKSFDKPEDPNMRTSKPPGGPRRDRAPKFSTSTKSKDPPGGSRKSPLVEYWNSLPGDQRKHKTPGSKIYQKAASHLRKMKQPGFFRRCGIDRGWMESRRIPEKALDMEWTENMIQQGFRALVAAGALGSPLSETVIGRLNESDLATLLFNPRSRK